MIKTVKDILVPRCLAGGTYTVHYTHMQMHIKLKQYCTDLRQQRSLSFLINIHVQFWAFGKQIVHFDLLQEFKVKLLSFRPLFPCSWEKGHDHLMMLISWQFKILTMKAKQ